VFDVFQLPSDGRPPLCEFVCDLVLRGRRIDTFLEKHLRNYSTFAVQRLIRAGCVTVNDETVPLAYRVHNNDTVRVRLIAPPDRASVAEPLPVEVLYEDPWLIGLSKPPGQISHPGGEFLSHTLVNALQHHLDRQTPLPGLLRPGIVHRIDRQTSGAMIVPKEFYSHRRLTQQFEQRRVSKTYLAIVHGVIESDQGRIELPIGQVPNHRCTLMCCKPNALDPRPALTEFRVLDRFDSYSFVEARPLTGRQHQIRVHFAEIGHPLLADEFYGEFGIIKDGTPFEASEDEDLELEPAQSIWFDPDLPLRRHALHAAALAFDHPVTEMPLLLQAPLPTDLRETLAILRLRNSSASPLPVQT